MLAIIIAILIALSFSLAMLIAQKGLVQQDTPWGVWVTLFTNCVFVLTAHMVLDPGARLLALSNITFVVVGLFVPGVARLLIFRGIRNLGSSTTTTILNSSPMFGATLAILFLGERPGPSVLLGIGFVVGGLMVLSWMRGRLPSRYTEMLFPLTAALLFGSKDVLVRWGVVASGSPTLGAAIAVTTATLEVWVILRCVQGNSFAIPHPRALLWFVISGFFTGCAFLLTFIALSIAEVTTVSPIFNCYSVFVLILAPLIARRVEPITRQKILGALGVVAGVALIAMGRGG